MSDPTSDAIGRRKRLRPLLPIELKITPRGSWKKAERALHGIDGDRAKPKPISWRNWSAQVGHLRSARSNCSAMSIWISRLNSVVLTCNWKKFLKLRRGSVITLDKLAGDPVDIFVNGRMVARGEVLVLNDNFCVRVAQLLGSDAIDKS